MFQSQFADVTTDPNKLEAQAKEVLSARAYAYVGGGAGERATMDANRAAFRSWKVGFSFDTASGRTADDW